MEVIGPVDFIVGFAVVAAIYAIFTLGLNVHWGFTGLFNIGVAGFFALGAYTSALLTSPPPDPALFEDFVFGGNWAQTAFLDLGFDLWFVLALGAAALACGAVAVVIGFATIRLRDDYLAIATLGIAESVRLFFLNEKWAANGSKGLYGIPKFLEDAAAPDRYDYLYLVVVVIALAAMFVAVERAVRSPWGRAIRAIREDETTAEASGKNVFAFKMQAFVMGAMIMGVGGALYAHNVRFLSPLTFDPLLATFVIWAMLMVGGAGSNAGAVLGAFLVWGIWSGTQFIADLLPFLPDILLGPLVDPNLRLFLIGALIVAVIVARPGGILGERVRRATTRSGSGRTASAG